MSDEKTLLQNFPGRERLIAALDTAVALGDTQAITREVRNQLCALMREGSVTLPACVHQAIPGRYARRELYRSAEHGYVAVAMTWGPGQGTPIHDHSGLWCVEAVWAGQLEITQYDVAERKGDDVRFIETGTLIAGVGSAGSLIPPHEYHAIGNASDSDIAVSLHVYASPMTCCGVFVESPHAPGWHRQEVRQLSLDAAA